MNKILKRYLCKESLDTLIFFVTDRCNFNCWFCCNKKSLKSEKDLPFCAIKKISQSLRNFRSLLISGGEPFLREDIDDIFLLFSKNNKIDNIYVPTNGWYTEKIFEKSLSFLEKNKKTILTLSFSIDSLFEKHDKERGIPNAFERACSSIKKLSKIKKSNFRIRVSSVVTNENIDDIKQTIDYFYKNFEIDEHSIEIVRGTNLKNQNYENISPIIDRFVELSDYATNLYIKKNSKSPLNLFSNKLGNALNLSYVKLLSEIKRDMVNGKSWPFKCTAGRNIIVLNADGTISLCELRNKILDLKDYDYNLKKVFPIIKKERKKIIKQNCSCTHGCFVGNSLQYSTKTLIKKYLPKVLSYVKK